MTADRAAARSAVVVAVAQGRTTIEPDRRRRLRDALRVAAPWLTDPERGPTTVDAGSCDRCAEQPRLLATCGPDAPGAVCRDCALTLGEDGWCAGHHDDGATDRRWAASLPPRWGDAVVLWWIATGEVRPTSASRDELVELALSDPAALRPALQQSPRTST